MASMLLHGEYAQFNDSFNKKTAAILKTSKQETTTCSKVHMKIVKRKLNQ